MKKLLVALVVSLIAFANTNAQTSINDYKYVVVPHYFDFLKGKNTYRLNTITRFLLKKKGLNAFMEDEIKARDYRDNKCLALKADVVNVPSMLKTKLKVLLKNCDDEVIFESEVGESKQKLFEKAYREALEKAFVSFEGINYTYKPNKEILSRKEANESDEEVAKLKAEIEKLKKEQTEKITEPKATIEKPATPKPQPEKEEKDYLVAKAIDNGFNLVNAQTKAVEFTIQNTAMNDVYTIKDKNGVIYKKDDVWMIEYTFEGKSIKKPLKIKF